MSDIFVCAECGETFRKAWPDDEAEAEYGVEFARAKAIGVQRAVVCDDCYNAIKARIT